MQVLDLAAFQSTALVLHPFNYLIVPGFVRPQARAAINADYPKIENPGSFPIEEVKYGPAFATLLATLRSKEVEQAFSEKFNVQLRGRPTMITVRGRCGPKDGHIHTDAVDKILTVLIYMNSQWEDAGGRLRLLRSRDNIDDVLVEVPPVEGTLVAFRRSNNSFHGHKPFIGVRRVIQLNWVVSRWVERRENIRHRVSAWMKRLGTVLRPRHNVGSETPAGAGRM
jgi:SM-20-related protein